MPAPAPEQPFTERKAIDARTDQFSFCVALYRALTGVAPFSGDALAANVLAGRVEPAPPKAALPAWLRRVLLRGLSVDPDARWPSMSALVDALGRDPARTRRRWGIAGGGARPRQPARRRRSPRNEARPAQLCLGAPARLAGVWEGADPTEPHARPRRRRERLPRDGRARRARRVWERVAYCSFDRYRAAWLSMYRDACEATSHARRPVQAAAASICA